MKRSVMSILAPMFAVSLFVIGCSAETQPAEESEPAASEATPHADSTLQQSKVENTAAADPTCDPGEVLTYCWCWPYPHVGCRPSRMNPATFCGC